MEGIPEKRPLISDPEKSLQDVLEDVFIEAGGIPEENLNPVRENNAGLEPGNIFSSAPVRRVRRVPRPQPVPETRILERNNFSETTYTPGETIRAVTFFRDEKGRLISSNTPNRKALLLDGEAANLNEIDVQIVRDTKPGKSDGFLIVSPIENTPDLGTVNLDSTPQAVETIRRETLALVPQHNRVVARHARSLRTIKPALALAREAMADNPLSQEILSRHDEMQEGLLPGERHRSFTALASAIFQDPKAKTNFDAGIDTVVGQKSKITKENLVSWEGAEPPLLPLLVIGTGPHGATFLASHSMYDTKGHTALAVDERKSIGGQFAKAQKAVFKLNSRNRPLMTGENRNTPYRPGTEQTINPMGDMSTVQVSDLSGEAFVSQDVPAYAARFNGFTSGCEYLAECGLINAEEVTRADGSLVQRCIFEDVTENRIYTIDTDNLIIPNGIGKEDFKLAYATEETRDDLREAEKQLTEGKRPSVMSFSQLVSWCGDSSHPSPFKGVKTAAISGSGDSAIVAAGILLGYEPGADRMPTALDRVESVIWLNQNIPSKEEWLEKVRARYIQVGLEFPREEIEGYYARIIPVADTKVQDLRTNTEKGTVNLFCQTDSGEERAYEADLYISCNGFTNQLPNILTGRRRKLPDQRNGIGVDFFTPGATVVDQGSGETIRITSVEGSTVEYIYYGGDGTIKSRGSVSYYNPFALEEMVSDYFSDPEYSYPEKVDAGVILQDNNQLPLGRRIGDNTFLLGPAAQIPVTEPEIERAPVLGKIPENSAALFRYGKGTEICAQLVAQRLNTYDQSRYDSLNKPATRYTVSASSTGTKLSYADTIPEAGVSIPQHIDAFSGLKIALQAHLDRLSIPIDLPELLISVEVDPLNEGPQAMSFALPGISDINDGKADLPLKDWLYKLADDPFVRNPIKKLVIKNRRAVRINDAARTAEVTQGIKLVNANLSSANRVTPPKVDRTRKMTLAVKIPTFKSRPLLNQSEMSVETV